MVIGVTTPEDVVVQTDDALRSWCQAASEVLDPGEAQTLMFVLIRCKATGFMVKDEWIRHTKVLNWAGGGRMSNRNPLSRFEVRYNDLWKTERDICDRYSDQQGRIENSDIAFLLSRIIHLRTLCGDMIRDTGRLYHNREGEEVAEVSAERLNEIEQEAIHLSAEGQGEPDYNT